MAPDSRDNEELPTPEERLLRIIEQPLNPVTNNALLQGKVSNRTKVPLSSVFRPQIAWFTAVLKLVVVGVAARWLVCLVIDGSVSSFDKLRTSPERSRGTLTINPEHSRRIDFSIKQRNVNLIPQLSRLSANIITPTFNPRPEKTLQPLESYKKVLGEPITDLKLVGISWGEVPEAMIEDIKEKQTYFVKPKERFQNIQVKQILKDTVVLTVYGEDRELILR